MDRNMMDYQKLLNPTARDIKPSGIRKFFDVAQGMKGVLSLSIGEPDFVTPWHIRNAGMQSLQKGQTYYTSNSGLDELRKEIANYLSRRFDLTYDWKKQTLVTVGGSEAIDACIRALVSPGDEVLIPEPSFVCYYPITQLAGAVPVPIKTTKEEKYKLTPEALKAAITDKTKLLIMPYPNNPTGGIMDREDLEKIAEVLRGTDIFVLSDEIYAELTYGKKHTSIVNIDGMYERTILVSGFSKAYAMTGWRIGYVCAPEEIMRIITKIHQFAIMCTPTTSQYAAVEALKNGDEDIERMRDDYDKRRRIIVDGLRRIGLECFEPEGAFYVFPSVEKTGLTSDEFCKQLLEKEKVAVVPGTAFGASGEGGVRISYCYSLKHILSAIDKIDKFLTERK